MSFHRFGTSPGKKKKNAFAALGGGNDQKKPGGVTLGGWCGKSACVILDDAPVEESRGPEGREKADAKTSGQTCSAWNQNGCTSPPVNRQSNGSGGRQQ